MMKKVIMVLAFGFVFFGMIPASFSEADFARYGTLIKFDDLIKRSLHDDTEVKRAEARLRKEEELYKAVKHKAFPKLTTDIYSAGVTQQNRGIIFWTSEIRLPVFEGGKWIHEKRKKSYQVASEKLNLETTREDLVYQLKTLYIALLTEKENTRLAQAWVKEAEKLYLSMKALLGKGLINREDLYRWEAAYRSAQNELVRHKEAMDYAESLIREMTQIPESERIDLEPLDDLSQSEFKFQPSLSQMKARNPLYEIVRFRAKAKEEEIKILRSDRFPKLGLSTRFNLARDSFIDQNRFEIGLVSSWNIWDFGVLGHEIKAKQAETEETREEGRIQTNQLEHELRKLIGDIKIAWAKMDALQSLLKEKKETYTNDKTRLIAYERSESELFDSFVALTQAQMALSESFAEYRLLAARLEMIIGSGVSQA